MTHARSRRALVASLLLAACASDPAAPATPTAPVVGVVGGVTVPAAPAPDMPGRGELVSANAGVRMPKLIVAAALVAGGAARAFSARHDAQPYVVRYRTPGVDGTLTVASGAVWFPVGLTANVPVVAYMHGTNTSKTTAPSNLLNTPEGDAAGAIWASDGSVLVAPDYLGLGVAGAGTYHPYLHAASEATAGVDLLRAARTLAAQLGVTLDRQNLFVTGYSQGGGAAMALARALERDHATELPLLGAAPMSGPYDLEGTSRTMLERDIDYHAGAVYTAYLVAAFDTVYRLAPRLSDLVAAPHDAVARRLRDGVASDAELASLPSRPQQVLRADVVRAMLSDRGHPFWLAARDNDLTDWAPRAPLRMYYGGADRDVYPENATTAESRMRARGARNVAAVNVGATLDHGDAVLPATLAARVFLDSLRRGAVR
jgi:hypothetical protein